MKALVASVLVVLFGIVFVHTPLSAEQMQSADMHLYAPTGIE